MNTEKVPHREVVQILRQAGDSVYSNDYVKVPVTENKEKRVAICSICGEAYIQMEEGDRYCLDCAKEKERSTDGFEHD